MPVSLTPIQRSGTRCPPMDMSVSPGRSGTLSAPRREGSEISRETRMGTRSRSLRLGRLMIDKTIFPFPKLGIHTVYESIDCSIHLRSRCLGLHSFATDGTRDFSLMLKLLDSQDYLKRSDLQPVSIQATESCFHIASKRRRDVHVATCDSQLHAHLQFRPGWMRSNGDQKNRLR